jgi:putative transposase
VRYAFIAEHVSIWPVRICCRVLQVSRSGFYKWQGREESPRQKENQALAIIVERIHMGSRRTYGSPRVWMTLKGHGYKLGRGRVERIMRREGLKGKVATKYRKTTDSRHGGPIAPNLLARNFLTAAPDRVWASDVTFIWTLEGWLYLGVTLDLFSRRVIGWSMSDTLDASLVVRALEMALGQRKPSAELIHHSDQGKEYANRDFRTLLSEHRITASMSRKGNCWDNAVAESFFHTLKGELLEDRRFRTRREAQAAVFEWIEVFYNRQRLHSTLGYVPPAVYEAQFKSVA